MGPTRRSRRAWTTRRAGAAARWDGGRGGPAGARHRADPGPLAARAAGARGGRSTFLGRLPDRATELATLASLCPLDPLDQARLARLRARILFGRSRSDEAAPLLLDAAAQFAAAGSPLARETYLEAISATVFAGRVHGAAGAKAAAVAARASGAPPSNSEAADLLCGRRRHPAGRRL